MNGPLLGAGAAALASGGAYCIFTSAVFGRQGGSPGSTARRTPVVHGGAGPTARHWLEQAGVGEVALREFAAAESVLVVVGVLAGYVVFGRLIPALVCGGFAGCVPVASLRARRQQRLAAAAEAWPRLLEELRLLTGSMGRSIPQALFEVGRRAPSEWSGAFGAAEREWLLTTDFGRTIDLLKDGLDDPTADAVVETLMVAHDVGGADLDRRLADLIEDRLLDLQGRKDAASRQAGVRFARRFVLLVPLGMTLAGLSIGSGRHAYTTTGGQVAVVIGLVSVIACWFWSGRLMRLPGSPRVFQ